ncbi:MAG: hypothetical protein KAY39_02835 [Burkholderiaceae bacterium]|nr:hypothetical protein [Burkholderiaceae bacterium]
MQHLASLARLTVLVASALGGQAIHAMTPLADADLQAVRGAGIAYNLQNFSFTGDVGLTYEGAPGQKIELNKLTLSRSDDAAATFTDPYTIQLHQRTGLPDTIRFTEPLNANGLLKWQFATDWKITTPTGTFDGGSLIVRDLQSYGGRFEITTPSVAGQAGVVWGSAVRVDIGDVLIRPRGRDDIANPDAPGATNQMRIQGIHISDAVDSNSPWVLADVTAQPGIFNAVTENGQSYLHLGIGWATNPDVETPAGKVVIDNITFRNSAPTYMDPMTGAATNTLNLGSSSIGSMQIQYLDLKMHAGR